jgi:hypothetical protein
MNPRKRQPEWPEVIVELPLFDRSSPGVRTLRLFRPRLKAIALALVLPVVVHTGVSVVMEDLWRRRAISFVLSPLLGYWILVKGSEHAREPARKSATGKSNMIRKSTALYVGFVVLIVTAWATPAITQGSAVQESALLNEVRLLRQAIEALAGNGSRIQLVFGRLQLQEQRTTAAVRRLTDARSALASHMVSMSAVANRLAELESASSSATAEELQKMQDMLVHYKRESARLEAERARLAAEEADAAQTLSSEQSRWSDLNRQVEELERLLMQRQ